MLFMLMSICTVVRVSTHPVCDKCQHPLGRQQPPPLQRFLSSEEANGLPLSKSARSCYVIFCIVLYVFFIVCCLSCSVCVVVYIICILLYLSLFPSVQCSSRQFSGVGFSPLFEVSPVFQLFVDHKISVQSSFSVGLMSRPVKLYLSVQSDSCISSSFVYLHVFVFYLHQKNATCSFDLDLDLLIKRNTPRIML
jgi:hypothetical protein